MRFKVKYHPSIFEKYQNEVTEQRPMNNEYINSWISKLSPVTLADIFKLYSKFS